MQRQQRNKRNNTSRAHAIPSGTLTMEQREIAHEERHAHNSAIWQGVQEAWRERKPLGDVFEAHAYAALAQAQQTLAEATYAEAMRGAAIAVDKMRLERGQGEPLPGQPRTIEERDAILLDLLNQIEQNAQDVPVDIPSPPPADEPG